MGGFGRTSGDHAEMLSYLQVWDLVVDDLTDAIFAALSGKVSASGVLTRVLRHVRGHDVTGADVRAVQTYLRTTGAPELEVTGVYDAATAAAVAVFQRSLGLPNGSLVTWQLGGANGHLTWQLAANG